MIRKIISFVTVGVWRIPLRKVSRAKVFLIRQLRIILLSVRGFGEDDCMLRASALTFYSLLSVVPVVAMALGIARGFGYQNVFKEQILERFPGQEMAAAKIIDFAHLLLENAKGGLVAGIGIPILFWIVIRVLCNIECSFNHIWGIRKSRSFGRKFSDYFSIMLICPILLVVSSNITVFITAQITDLAPRVKLLSIVSPFFYKGLKLLPYLFAWILFTFIYIFMPNTKVKFSSGLLAGIVAGTIYQIVQWAYITFQFGMAKYSTVYGSFAALPLFLIWVQISWLLVFFGAELSFAHQNVETYEFEPDCLKASYSFRKLLSLVIVRLLIEKFSGGKKPITAPEIARTLETPIRLVNVILYELVKSGLVSETAGEEGNSAAYQPGCSTETLTIKTVVDALENSGISDIPVSPSRELEKISEYLKTLSEVVKKSPANMLLRDI